MTSEGTPAIDPANPFDVSAEAFDVVFEPFHHSPFPIILKYKLVILARGKLVGNDVPTVRAFRPLLPPALVRLDAAGDDTAAVFDINQRRAVVAFEGIAAGVALWGHVMRRPFSEFGR